jgi:hypothetical protein
MFDGKVTNVGGLLIANTLPASYMVTVNTEPKLSAGQLFLLKARTFTGKDWPTRALLFDHRFICSPEAVAVIVYSIGCVVLSARTS